MTSELRAGGVTVKYQGSGDYMKDRVTSGQVSHGKDMMTLCHGSGDNDIYKRTAYAEPENSNPQRVSGIISAFDICALSQYLSITVYF